MAGGRSAKNPQQTKLDKYAIPKGRSPSDTAKVLQETVSMAETEPGTLTIHDIMAAIHDLKEVLENKIDYYRRSDSDQSRPTQNQ